VKVVMIAPERRECGIGDFTRELVTELPGHVEVQWIPVERIGEYDLHTLEADVVHLQYEHGFFLAADDPAGNVDRLLARIEQPTLITLHCLPLDDPRWGRWLTAPGFVFHAQSHAHVVALRQFAPAVRVLETLPAIAGRVAPAETPAEFRSRFGIPAGPLLAVFGFIKPHKGHDVALAALERLPDDVSLLFAGGAQDADDEAFVRELRAAAVDRGLGERLHITGYLEAGSVGPALLTADVVLSPFHSVTASASLGMALAWGRPVVASALPQFRELETRFGTPRCVPVGDAAQLASAVSSLRSNPI